MTCCHADHCVYAKRAVNPVLFCEMFDDQTPRHDRSETVERAVARLTGETKKAGASTSGEGLCANCAKRHRCRHPRPEGGVWHCEEYD